MHLVSQLKDKIFKAKDCGEDKIDISLRDAEELVVLILGSLRLQPTVSNEVADKMIVQEH